MTQQSRPKFCNRCGAVLEVNYNFCKDCGNPIKVGVDISSSNPNQYINNSSVGFWNKLSTFGKITIIGGALLLLIGIGTCLTMSLSTSVNDIESTQAGNDSKPVKATTKAESSPVSNNSKPVKATTKAESSPVNQVINIDDFWAERTTNEINFESKYLNTTVQLSGAAGSPVEYGASYRFTINSTNPYTFSLEEVYCITNKETAVSLSSGQKIVISGTLTKSEWPGEYDIKNCIVINKDPVPQTTSQTNTEGVINIDDFWAERTTNEINFESKYLNTTVQLSGAAGSPVEYGASYRFTINSTNPYTFSLEEVYCITNKETAVSLSSGQKIVISGTLTKSEWPGEYDIKNCIVK